MFSSRENQGYYGFDIRFSHESGWVPLICHVLQTHCYKTYIGGRSYSSTTDTLLDFCTNKKLSSIYRYELIVIYCALISWWNIKRCLQLRRNSNLQLSLILFFYFSVVKRKRLARGGKLWSHETLLYPNISNYVREKLLFCSTYVKLEVK